jgi:hypothetical protein
MRRVVFIGSLVTTLAVLTATASARTGVNPAQLQRAGWSCVNPAAAFPANTNVHCFPPGHLQGVIAGTAATALLLTFATSDISAEHAPLLGQSE